MTALNKRAERRARERLASQELRERGPLPPSTIALRYARLASRRKPFAEQLINESEHKRLVEMAKADDDDDCPSHLACHDCAIADICEGEGNDILRNEPEQQEQRS